MQRTAIVVAAILALSLASVAHAGNEYSYISTEKVYIQCTGVG